MKTTWKVLSLVLGIGLLGVGGVVAFVAARGIPRYTVPTVVVATPAGSPAQLELGEKIVRVSCAGCHLNPQNGRLSGGAPVDAPANFGRLYAANITQDPTHGIGRWTDAELAAVVRTGIGRDGRYRVLMPHFTHLSAADMEAVLAFLHSAHPLVQATATPVPAQAPSLLMKLLTNTVMKPSPLLASVPPTPAGTPALAYGQYLVTGRYVCFECHSKSHETNNELAPAQSAGYLGGGTEFHDQQGLPVRSPNITSDPDAGIGRWTPAQLAAALRLGQSAHGPLRAPMPKYSTLTEEEVQGIYAYLQSVPKLPVADR